MISPREIPELMEEVEQKSDREAADLLVRRPPEEIQSVLSHLEADRAAAVASYLPESAAPTDSATTAVTQGLEQTVGELMTSTLAVMPPDATVAEALVFLVKAKDVTDVTYIYVTEQQCLVGVVVMRDLILAKPAQTLAEIMIKEPFAFQPDMPLRDAINEALVRHYPLYPVVDQEQQLLGVVRGWKLYERIATELSGQAGAQVGLTREEQINTPVLAAFRLRHPWLQFNLLTAFVVALVVGLFEGTIAQIVALAIFMPVLAGQSGNTGSQALAITLRGLTLGRLRGYPTYKLLRKEILLGALNGFFVGIIAALAMFGYATASGESQPAMLGAVVLMAMTGACTCSGIFGVMVPLTLKRFGADPATASSIFLTTFTDIIGIGLMLLLATTLILGGA